MQHSLAEKAYQYILDKLVTWQWPPGTQLVTRALAREIGVSAIPLREAIQRLVAEGLLTHLAGVGAFVPHLDQQDILDLCTLRESLESFAAAEAARRATERELMILGEICTQFWDAAKEVAESGQPHATHEQWVQSLRVEDHFHSTLIAAAHNRWLSKVTADLRLLSRIFGTYRDLEAIATPQAMEVDARKHEQLVEVLRRRAPEEASRLMSEHVHESADHLLRRLARESLSQAVQRPNNRVVGKS